MCSQKLGLIIKGDADGAKGKGCDVFDAAYPADKFFVVLVEFSNGRAGRSCAE